MCGFQQAGRQWLQSGCLVYRPIHNNPQHGQPAKGLSQNPSGGHPWRQPRQEAAGPSGTMSDVDSTQVVYKLRQWSLPGAAVMPVLNVSSRVTCLELDDRALLDSYTVLQEGIFVMFSRKSVQLHGRARRSFEQNTCR